MLWGLQHPLQRVQCRWLGGSNARLSRRRRYRRRSLTAVRHGAQTSASVLRARTSGNACAESTYIILNGFQLTTKRASQALVMTIHIVLLVVYSPLISCLRLLRQSYNRSRGRGEGYRNSNPGNRDGMEVTKLEMRSPYVPPDRTLGTPTRPVKHKA